MTQEQQSKETYRISVRIPSDEYRVADRLLRKKENAHIQTMSDFVRRGFQLALIEAARNVPDPEWAEVAELVEKKRELEARRRVTEWKLQVQQEEWLAEPRRPKDN